MRKGDFRHGMPENVFILSSHLIIVSQGIEFSVRNYLPIEFLPIELLYSVLASNVAVKNPEAILIPECM